MAKIPEVSLETWRKLYAAAAEFEARHPWELFDDSMLFGVQDPATGQMGYACVLGALGEVLALVVYRGARGFEAHRRMQEGEIDPDVGGLMAFIDSLTAEFTSRDILEKADLAVIRKLGLRFRGPKAWPYFRSSVPEYAPWHLTEAEAAFLTFALHCGCDAAKRVEAEELKLDERPGQVYCYIPTDNAEAFETRWEPYPAYRPEPELPLALDPARLTELREKPLTRGRIWEADIAFMPACLSDRDRPYMPRSPMVVDRESLFILHTGVEPPGKPAPQVLAEALLKAMEIHGERPAEVHVRGDELAGLLAPLGRELGLRVAAAERLDAVLQVRRELEGFLQKKRPPEPAPPRKLFDRRIMEKVTSTIARKLRGKDFESEEEANRYLRELEEEGDLDAMPAPEGPVEVAQDLMYRAFEEPNLGRRIEMARRALKISPDCADAYSLLAEETAASLEARRDLYQKAVEAGERALGKRFFKENAGHFWGMVETRPYMRARAELARCLWLLGEQDAALGHWYELLRLNPSDNQGMRYVLAGRLAEAGRFKELEELLARKQYEDDCGLEWLLARTLAAFARLGPSPEADAELRDALKRNKHFSDYFLKRKRLPRRSPDLITLGGEDEAIHCAQELLPAWRKVAGALDWLAGTVDKPPLPKAGRNDPCPCGSGKKYKKCCLEKAAASA